MNKELMRCASAPELFMSDRTKSGCSCLKHDLLYLHPDHNTSADLIKRTEYLFITKHPTVHIGP